MTQTHAEHHHHHHDHTHGMAKESLRLAFLLTLIILVSQLVGGLLANSLALLSEAGHVVTDLFALGLAWFAAAQAERPANARKTFGYHRVGILAALANAVTLIAIAGGILFEAAQRLQHPEPVQPLIMFVTPLISIAVNLFISFRLHKSEQSLNTRAALLHVIGDVGASAAVIVGGVIVLLLGWTIVDPLLSIGISLLLAVGSWRVVRETIDILLEAAPRNIPVAQVAEDMKQVEGVEDVHDLHVWTIASGMSALSCHAHVADLPPSGNASILRSLTQMLRDKYQISHATIQLESNTYQKTCYCTEDLYCCMKTPKHDHQHEDAQGAEEAHKHTPIR